VQELIEVPVPRTRSMRQFVSPAFLATRARLEELIYIGRHVPEEQNQDEDYPILACMTNVGDNVE